MIRNFLLLFLALRAADILNLAGGMWLVPKYVAPEDLGAVLPLTTFATFIAIPLYAIAMTALREASRLRSLNQSPRSLIRGVFAATGITAVFALTLAAVLLPRALDRFHVTDSLSGYLAVAAAFLGCVSPVYLDQLQAAKRFGAVGIVEISAAATRLMTMAIIMPFRAMAGYFAGAVAKPLVQILGPLLALIAADLKRPVGRATPRGATYWTRGNFVGFLKTFALLLAYLAFPMFASLTESDMIRTLLPATDSAGYYMATRISDLMNYLTYPILFVMFPYVTNSATHGESTWKTVINAASIPVVVALACSVVTKYFGVEIISLLPKGENYAAYAQHLPTLFMFMGFGAAQAIITNGEVAAGRYSFLWWLIPMHIAYIEVLPRVLKHPKLDDLVGIFFLFALLRCVAALLHLRFRANTIYQRK